MAHWGAPELLTVLALSLAVLGWQALEFLEAACSRRS